MPGSSRKQEVVIMGGVTPAEEGQKGHLGASNVGSSCPQTAWTHLGPRDVAGKRSKVQGQGDGGAGWVGGVGPIGLWLWLHPSRTSFGRDMTLAPKGLSHGVEYLPCGETRTSVVLGCVSMS